MGHISPTLSVENIGGSLPGHSTDPEGVAQNAWYPGVSMLGPLADLYSSQRATPSASGAVFGDSADLELEVWCIGDQLTLGVGTKLNGVELNPESLTLGNGCKSNGLVADRLWFTYYLTQCGTTQSVRGVWWRVLGFKPLARLSTLWILIKMQSWNCRFIKLHSPLIVFS